MRTAVALTLLALGVAHAAENQAEITKDEIEAHIGYLASDALEGRGTATRGERLAGQYIADQFQKYGIKPGSAEGTYFQPFEVTGRQTLEGQPTLRVDVGRWHRDFSAKTDFSPFGFSADFDGTVPLVFAGYGITEDGYDDYAGLDVKGKAVLVLRHQPNEKAGPLGRGAIFTTKAKNAKDHGAVALLVVTDPLNHPKDDDVLPFGGGADAGIAAAHLRRSLVEGLLRLAGKDLLGIQKGIDATKKPNSFPLDATLQLSVKVKRSKATARNVVGVLPGTDPKLAGEFVVIGAHYDHLGRGHMGGSLQAGAGGEIHNGADDNASGTAGLLELAQAFAAKPARRTIYFVGFSGEERGLLGSAHFVKAPPVERKSIVAMLNLDMIGRLTDDKLEIGGAGTAPNFSELATQAAEAEGLKVKLTQSGFGPSDHASFYKAEIPVLFFFTGLHKDYHRPSDDADTIEGGGAQRVARAAFACADAVANADERPQYVKIARERRGRRSGARMGVMPDRGYKGPGVALTEVIEGGPAAKAGLKAGDVLLEVDGQKTDELRALLRILGKKKPGDTVKVHLLRDGKREVINLKLG